jgi:hypothetical protein
MSAEDFMKMTEAEKMAFLESQQTEVKLCKIDDPSCLACE